MDDAETGDGLMPNQRHVRRLCDAADALLLRWERHSTPTGDPGGSPDTESELVFAATRRMFTPTELKRAAAFLRRLGFVPGNHSQAAPRDDGV